MLKKAIKEISMLLDEMFRYFLMRYVLSPASVLLPKRCALRLADLGGLVISVLPVPGFTTYKTMSRAFGVKGANALRLSRGWIARPFRDFVILKRILNGREEVEKWQIVEENSKTIDRLRKSGQSYIVATGHFAREAALTVYLEKITPGMVIFLRGPVPVRKGNIYNLRMSLQFGTIVKSMTIIRPKKIVTVVVLKKNNYRSLLDYLSRPGNVLLINIDAPLGEANKKCYERGFAAHKSRMFATGTARLARMAGCPILTCIPQIREDNTIVLDWGDAIYYCKGKNVEERSDLAIMDQLLDRLELGVGQRPTQYVLPIGTGRKWDHKMEKWREI